VKFETLLNSSRWNILEALARGEFTASELARITKSSLPNISQQAKLLEAYEVIKTRREEKQGPGKPRTIYELNKNLAHIAVARKGFAGKKTLTLDTFHNAVLNIWFLDRADDHYYLQKFLWQNEELIKECLGMALVEARGDELHLLVLAAPEKLEHLRKKFSKAVISSQEKQRSVIAWTHSVEEMREGLARDDTYYKNLLKKPHIIVEKDDVFREFMKK
jgi:DNA-binding transcriptional ArsR family regulator